MPTDPRLPMLPWYPESFATETRGWSLLERGLYRELLDAQWLLGSLPTDQQTLIKIARVTSREFKRAWPRVQTKFTVDAPGCMTNDVQKSVRIQCVYRHARYVTSGRRGGLASAQVRDKSRIDSSEASSHPSSPASSHPSRVAQASLKHLKSKNKNKTSESESLSDSSSVLDRPSLPDSSLVAKNKFSRIERGVRIPEPFHLTSAMRAWASEHAPRVDVHAGTLEFVEFWRAVPGARGRKVNWELVWRCRMRALESRAAHREATAPEATRYDRLMRAVDGK